MNLNIFLWLPPNHYINIGFNNSGVLNSWKAIILTNADPVGSHIYATLGCEMFMRYICMCLKIPFEIFDTVIWALYYTYSFIEVFLCLL